MLPVYVLCDSVFEELEYTNTRLSFEITMFAASSSWALVIRSVRLTCQPTNQQYYSLILNRHQPPATSQSAVLFSHNRSSPATSHSQANTAIELFSVQARAVAWSAYRVPDTWAEASRASLSCSRCQVMLLHRLVLFQDILGNSCHWCVVVVVFFLIDTVAHGCATGWFIHLLCWMKYLMMIWRMILWTS